jgi:dihydroorotate dehydrogenase (fumarate)
MHRTSSRRAPPRIELNIYFIPSDPAVSGSDVEARYLDIVHAVTSAVKIPGLR